jgi:glycosyltransferase involved in cell wall biosynthesis
MKLGVYVQTWHVGGVAAFCERLARGLQQLGHAPCVILATPFSKRDDAGRKAYQALVSNSPFPVCCLHLSAFHPKERAWRAADRIAALGCDALILSSHGPLAGAWAHLCPNIPTIGIAHNDDEDTYAEFKACVAYCDAYVAVSKAIYQSLKLLAETNSPVRVCHIPHGVPLQAAPDAGPQSSEVRVLVVCRLEQGQKRVLDLPLIWQEYRRRGGKGTLSLCGSGPQETQLRKAFAKELAQGGVNILGAVPLDKMPEVYARHDVLLSVSAYEGLPISVLEATTHGLFPLLSAIRSGHQEIVEAVGSGRLCPMADSSGFASALLEITTDLQALRQLRPLIQSKARSLFDPERMVQNYSHLVAEVYEARTTGRARQGSASNTRPKVDFLRSFLRKWQYSRHYGWQD